MRAYFKMDFSNVTTEELHSFNLMLRSLETCIPADDGKIKEIWDMFYQVGVYVRSEIYNRNEVEREEAKKRAKKEEKKKHKSSLTIKKPIVARERMPAKVKEATKKDKTVVKPKMKQPIVMPKKWKL